MTRRTLFFILCLALGLLPSVAAQDGSIVRQWASGAEATSQFSPTDWGAQQATGAPDTERCADLPTAWASATATGTDSLTLYYAQPVMATEVNIYQTFNPGAIVQVTLISPTGEESAVPKSADADTECPGVFDLDFAPEFFTQAVRIDLDQTRTGNWNEIDAVELVGFSDPSYNGPLLDIPGDGVAAPRTSPSTGATPSAAQPAQPTAPPNRPFAPDTPMGRSVTCDTGGSFSNGIPVTVVQMRANSNYTATAVGINGFDPVLAVLDENNRGLCNDDNRGAAYYDAQLPTTGYVAPSGLTAQVQFNTFNAPAFSDITLVVGGFNDATGEFLLILEGMTASAADNAGDPFSVEITPGMIASGVAPSAYMIAVTNVFDPLMRLIDGSFNQLIDAQGTPILCDDAGNPNLCYGPGFALNNSYVSRTQNRRLPGGTLDAMLTVPLQPGMEGGFINFLMTRTQNTFGDYVVVFHFGIGDPGEFIALPTSDS